MDESLSSLSDVRITSLITTSITDMVRQEVSKIMEELNMPVCTAAIDRIIAENLDKEVEKQNFVKTYKRKLNEVNQYKCIEKRAEPDEVVITNLQLIECRVKKLEDFVLQNLKQRPQLMQDLADRSRENLMMAIVEPQEEKTIVKAEREENKCEEKLKKETAEVKEICAPEPTLLNLDDVIQVIKECPETQDSFDVFQSAAERIKHDLERFIQEYKSDLSARARKMGRIQLETKKIAKSKSPEREKNIKAENSTKEIKVLKTAIRPEVFLEATESVSVISTGFDGGAVCEANQNAVHETDSDDTVADLKLPEIDTPKAAQEIVRPTIDEITKVAMEATIDLQTEQKTENEVIKNATGGGDKISVAQHTLITSMSGGDKPENDAKEHKLSSAPPTQQQHELKNAKTGKVSKAGKECKQCKECTERMQTMRERSRSYAIDEDIKWKLDKILDHIGDFCSRSRSGKESISEPDRKSMSMKTFQQQKSQPGTSADLTKRKMTRSSSVKPKQKLQQHAALKSNATAATKSQYDRKNLDKIMEQIMHMNNQVHHKRQEVVVTNVMSKPTAAANNTATIAANANSTITASTEQPPATTKSSKVSKSLEHPRNSVEAFKTKWGQEYSKTKSAAAATAAATTEQHAKNTAKSTLQYRSNLEAIPKAAMKKRQQHNDRSLPPLTLTLPHHQQQFQQQAQQYQVVQKSSTTLMLESIDQMARSAAVASARMERAGLVQQNEIGWVYSRRQPPQTPQLNLNEVRRTKVLYHNYKL